MDSQRNKKLWKIYKQGINFRKNFQVKNEWWIMWRRVAGGMSSGQQRQFIQDIRPILISRKSAKVRISAQERIELWMAVANMERLTIKDKIEYGRVLLKEFSSQKVKPQLFWAISRIGARELLYGPVDRVIPPDEVENWILTLMDGEWENIKAVGSAISQMARKTGDRMRDLEPDSLEQVHKWLEKHQLSEEAEILTKIKPMSAQDESAIFGESLPSGIMLHE